MQIINKDLFILYVHLPSHNFVWVVSDGVCVFEWFLLKIV